MKAIHLSEIPDPPAEGVGADRAQMSLPRPGDFDRDVYCIAGLPFDAVDMAAAVSRVRDAAAQRMPCFVSTPNLNFLIAARTDPALRESVLQSDLNLADGMPVIWLARWLGIPIRERVAGSSLFEALRTDVAARLSVYFFGGPDGVAEAACRMLDSEAGGLVSAGFQSPGFASVDALSGADRIDAINASGADFLVVSLGACKGQAWIMRNRARITVPVVSHLGAVVNFTAAAVQRAPVWMQRTGLEWLWRIKEEPALWRRYGRDGLGMIDLAVRRVLPYALWLRFSRLGPGAGRGGYALLLSEEEAAQRLEIQGTIPDPVPEDVRDALRKAIERGGPVVLDIGQAGYIGPGFFGLLLVLKKHLDTRDRVLRIVGLTERMRRLFRWNSVDYLLNDAEYAEGAQLMMEDRRQNGEGVSAEVPDWSRERPRRFWDPSRQLLTAIRRYQRLAGRRSPVALIARKFYVLQHRVWSVVTGADIPLTCRIGGGLLIPHPNGIVIHPEARIGPNSLISQQVTVGTWEGLPPPVIGRHVDIGPGAKILGPVSIGDHAKIGANAVVLDDVAPGDIVVGVPARNIGGRAMANMSRPSHGGVVADMELIS